MDKSVDTPLYLEAFFILSPDVAYRGTPEILAPPIFIFSKDQNLSVSLGAKDSSDFTLYYKLRTPQSGIRRNVLNYIKPETMELNQFNGLLTWDGTIHGTPVLGETASAVYVYQFQGDRLIGYTMRDFQIIVQDNEAPNGRFDTKVELNENKSIHLNNDEEKSIKLIAEGDNAEEISLAVFSELSVLSENFEFTTYDSTDHIKVAVFTMKHSPSIVRTNPYNITVRATYGVPVAEEKDLSFLIYTNEQELAEPPSSIDNNVILAMEGDATNLTLFPNPVKDHLTINGNQFPPLSVKLLSLVGTKVTDLSFDNNQVDFRRVDPGLYILQIAFKNGATRTVKIVKS